MHRGYIKVWRRLRESSLWPKRRPYSPVEAWLDLLMTANHTNSKAFVDGTERVIARGDVLTSNRAMATRWNWSESRVRRFLNSLQICSAIERKSTHQATHLTIAQYELYQEDRRSVRRNSDARPTTSKVIKNVRRRTSASAEESETPAVSDAIPHQKVVDCWNELASEHGLPKVRRLTDKRRKKIASRYREWQRDAEDGKAGTTWNKIVAAILAQPFYLGTNDRGWRVTFDYVTRDETTWTTILEGGDTTTKETQWT